ncbi:hypothetical protein RRG08_008040 [Elysia crispata]|uniref:Uncharacterized protein n=1 Tax=Elysia crispata TaxID=231223 RepID=A0AAE1DYP3_9GAST|nr:hypothetical protein RRG08_008040 [Elysia crispata]
MVSVTQPYKLRVGLEPARCALCTPRDECPIERLSECQTDECSKDANRGGDVGARTTSKTCNVTVEHGEEGGRGGKKETGRVDRKVTDSPANVCLDQSIMLNGLIGID